MRDSAGVLSLVTGFRSRLIGCIGGGLCLVNTSLSPGVHILDLLGVLGVHFIEFGQAVIDRIDPLLHPLLARHGVYPTPESFSLFSVFVKDVEGEVCCAAAGGAL